MILLLVALGGGLGAVVRFVLGSWVYETTGGSFPWGTGIINVTGAFAIGFLIHYLTVTDASATWRAFLVVGFLGGYTTFSTFSWETVVLMRGGEWPRAMLYVTGSVLLSLAATMGGIRLGSAIKP